ncbi:MAG: hypothetical protein NW215_03070 [Hyphomicrobiales bacterium]|nr:hypothetical protein [Hyphomicrobiales bacterium]
MFAYQLFMFFFHDLPIVLWDKITGPKRRFYSGTATIKAPRSDIWRFLTADRTELTSVGLVFERTPAQEESDVYSVKISSPRIDKPINAVYRRVFVEPERRMVLQMLSVDSTEVDAIDGFEGYALEDTPKGVRLQLFEDGVHRLSRAQLNALQVTRGMAHLFKREIEGPKPPLSLAGKAALHSALLVGFIASFAYLINLQAAIILAVVILLHELGHVIAMRMVGVPVAFVGLIPFLGGVAAPKRAYDNDAQHAFVALMGPGFSVLPALVALLWFFTSGDAVAKEAALLFTSVNAINLAPLYPLDGGVIAQKVLASLNRGAAKGYLWICVLGAATAALYLQEPFFLLFAALCLPAVMMTSDLTHERMRMPALRSGALFLGYLTVLAALIGMAFLTLDHDRFLDGKRSFFPAFHKMVSGVAY